MDFTSSLPNLFGTKGFHGECKRKSDVSNKEKLFKAVLRLKLSISMIKAGTLNIQTHQQ
jgi:hypothetical protein